MAEMNWTQVCKVAEHISDDIGEPRRLALFWAHRLA